MAEPLRYPLKKLDRSDDYLKIDVVRYKAPGLSTQNANSFALNSADQTYASLGTRDILRTIILPIQGQIGDSNAASWDVGTLNPLESALYNTALGGITGGAQGALSAIQNVVGKVLNASQTAVGQRVVQTAIAGEAVKAITGSQDASSIISRAQGVVFNQNAELLFTGVNLRSPFSFNIDMVPRSKDESEMIKNIIRTFKVYSAAKKGNTGGAEGLFLKSPEVFRIQYMSGGNPHPFLNKFKICALINMNVNYTGSGSYATYSDATPVHMQMGLTFQELTPIYYEDYVDENSNFRLTGVGY